MKLIFPFLMFISLFDLFGQETSTFPGIELYDNQKTQMGLATSAEYYYIVPDEPYDTMLTTTLEVPEDSKTSGCYISDTFIEYKLNRNQGWMNLDFITNSWLSKYYHQHYLSSIKSDTIFFQVKSIQECGDFLVGRWQIPYPIEVNFNLGRFPGEEMALGYKQPFSSEEGQPLFFVALQDSIYTILLDRQDNSVDLKYKVGHTSDWDLFSQNRTTHFLSLSKGDTVYINGSSRAMTDTWIYNQVSYVTIDYDRFKLNQPGDGDSFLLKDLSDNSMQFGWEGFYKDKFTLILSMDELFETVIDTIETNLPYATLSYDYLDSLLLAHNVEYAYPQPVFWTVSRDSGLPKFALDTFSITLERYKEFSEVKPGENYLFYTNVGYYAYDELTWEYGWTGGMGIVDLNLQSNLILGSVGAFYGYPERQLNGSYLMTSGGINKINFHDPTQKRTYVADSDWHFEGESVYDDEGYFYGVAANYGNYRGGKIFKCDKEFNCLNLYQLDISLVGCDLDYEDFSSVFLTMGTDHKLYLSAMWDGTACKGAIYQAAKDGSAIEMIYDFPPESDVEQPMRLIEGSDGYLYGIGNYGPPFRLLKDGSDYSEVEEISGGYGSMLIESEDHELYFVKNNKLFKINKDEFGYEEILNNLPWDMVENTGVVHDETLYILRSNTSIYKHEFHEEYGKSLILNDMEIVEWGEVSLTLIPFDHPTFSPLEIHMIDEDSIHLQIKIDDGNMQLTAVGFVYGPTSGLEAYMDSTLSVEYNARNIRSSIRYLDIEDNYFIKSFAMYNDSIVYSEAAIISTKTISICNGDSIMFGNQNLNNSGVYNHTFQTSYGYDSLVLLKLTLDSTFIQNETALLCEGDSLMFGNQVLTNPGEYMEVFQTSNGCDSILVLSLDVEECQYLGIAHEEFKIYPNPTIGVLKVDFVDSFSGKIKLVDVSGHIVDEHHIEGRQTDVLLSKVPSGIYLLFIIPDNGIISKTKIIKK